MIIRSPKGLGDPPPQISQPRYSSLRKIMGASCSLAWKVKYAKQLARWLRYKAGRAEAYATKYS